MKSFRLNDEQFSLLCRDNRDLRIEMTAAGDLIIMSPTHMETGRKSGRIFLRLATWAERDGTGECFDSSSLLTLPNGAKRSPDASWILKSRWNKLSDEEKSKFSRIYPDFVPELRSPSDKLQDLQEKLEEYIANGVRLGWLLDPIENVAFVYTSGSAIRRIDQPTLLSGEPVLPRFEFDFREIL
jgi:Uma2 family endonuclease